MMQAASLVHGTLVNAVSLQCAARIAANPPPISPTLARLYELSRDELASQFSPDSLIDGEPFSVWLERLRAVQAEQRKAAVEEERRLHEVFPHDKEYGRGWKMTTWRQYGHEKDMYEKCVRADEQGLARPKDKFARTRRDKKEDAQAAAAENAGGGVERTNVPPRYPACECPRCVWQAREALQEPTCVPDSKELRDFVARYGLRIDSCWSEYGDLASVCRLYKASPQKGGVNEVDLEEGSSRVGWVFGSCDIDMSVEVYSKPVNLQAVLEKWAKRAEEQPLKELCEDWDLVFEDKTVDEGADISPKVYVYAHEYNSSY
ncbi:hypothetical protein NBRC10512v2_003184 [Rhodotorula toruloides]